MQQLQAREYGYGYGFVHVGSRNPDSSMSSLVTRPPPTSAAASHGLATLWGEPPPSTWTPRGVASTISAAATAQRCQQNAPQAPLMASRDFYSASPETTFPVDATMSFPKTYPAVMLKPGTAPQPMVDSMCLSSFQTISLPFEAPGGESFETLRVLENALRRGDSRPPSFFQAAAGGRQQQHTVMRQVSIPQQQQQPVDEIDQQVNSFLRTHPEVLQRHKVVRKRRGVYEVNGHEIWIELQQVAGSSSWEPFVIDGPLRQPFSDYMMMTENNAIYDTGAVAKTSTLHHVPKERRMTFDDTDERYSRLEAMKVAKEQALIREQAANLAKQGKQYSPDTFMQKYTKTLKQRLRNYRSSRHDRQPKEKSEENDSDSQSSEKAPQRGASSPVKKTNSGGQQRRRDAENIDPKPNIDPGVKLEDGGKGKHATGSDQKADNRGESKPPPPPWAAIAPRGISLNGLPVGLIVPSQRMSVYDGAPGSAGSSYVPPPSRITSYVPPPSRITSYVPPVSANGSYVPPASCNGSYVRPPSYVPSTAAARSPSPSHSLSTATGTTARSTPRSARGDLPRPWPPRTWSGQGMEAMAMVVAKPVSTTSALPVAAVSPRPRDFTATAAAAVVVATATAPAGQPVAAGADEVYSAYYSGSKCQDLDSRSRCHDVDVDSATNFAWL